HSLIEKGEVEHAYPGISGGDITPEYAPALNLPGEVGVITQGIRKGGPGDKAGVHGSTKTAPIDGGDIGPGGDTSPTATGKEGTRVEGGVAIGEESGPGEELEPSLPGGGQEKKARVTGGTRPSTVSQSGGGGAGASE